MNQNKIAIVVPTHILPSRDWTNALIREAKIGHADIIIVDGSKDGLARYLPESWKVYDFDRQKEFLGELYEDFAKMFHGGSACRVFGHIVAYKENYEVIIGLDNDCIVPFNFVEDHLKMLNTEMNGGWINPLGGSGLYTRGYPYSMRNWKTVANMGLWENVLDINGKDRKPNELRRTSSLKHFNAPAPIPFSGMNWAITREAIFGYLFLPNFDYVEVQKIDNDKILEAQLYKFRRIDDIWGGYIFQCLLRKLKLGVTYGQPVVFHDTVVVPEEDEAEEEAMYRYEDEFVNLVDDTISEMLLTGGETTINDYMKAFITEWKNSNSGFIDNLTPAFEWWAKVIQKYGN